MKEKKTSRKLLEAAVAATPAQTPLTATEGQPSFMQVQFFDPQTQQHYVIGTPVSRLDEQRITRAGGRGLYGTHSRGRELFATINPGDRGWTIAVEPIRGMFDFLVVPYAAKSSIDQVTV